MTDLTTPTPEGAATTPVESTTAADVAATTQARAADGKFAAVETTEPSAPTEPEVAADAVAKPEPEKPRSRAAERINQLIAEKNSAIRDAAVLRQRYEGIQKAPKAEVDPNDFDAVQRESMRGVIREETAQQTATQYNEAVGRARRAQAETFYAKVEAARERIPDIDQTIQNFGRLPLSDEVCELIAESDVAAELAHHISLNPRIVDELRGLSPAQQGRALARIEAKLSLPTRRTSTTPPPTPSVNGSGAPTARAPSEMSIAEMQASFRKSGVIR